MINNSEFSATYRNTNYSLKFYSKSKLYQIKQMQYLDNIWLSLNMLTIGCCKSELEKETRFYEIIDKINNCIKCNNYIDIEILPLLLLIIGKYGTLEQLLTLFSEIIFKNELLSKDYTLYNFILTKSSSKYFNITKKIGKTNTISSRNAILMKKDSKNIENNNNDDLFLSKRGIIYSQNNNVMESLEFCVKTMCPYCRVLNTVDYSKIMEMGGEMPKLVFNCGKCKKNFIPRIKVDINNEYIENFELMTCFEVYNNIKKIFFRKQELVVDLVYFKVKYHNIFWNAIFYFSINKMSFYFVTPYMSDLKKYKNCSLISKDFPHYSDLYYEKTALFNIPDSINRKVSISEDYRKPYVKLKSSHI